METQVATPGRKKDYTINYIAIITKYSWWIDVKKRKWVVVDRSIDVMNVNGKFIYTGRSVTLLEEKKEDPIEQRWDDIVKMIEVGKMEKLRPDNP